MSRVFIVPDVRSQSDPMKESNSNFICPAHTVITGRYHLSDENGDTIYEYATLKALDDQGQAVAGNITIEDIREEPKRFAESSGYGFDAPFGRVIVGRQHFYDENGDTVYHTALVKFNGAVTTIINYGISEAKKESRWVWFMTDEQQVMTGRHHQGDENGNTYYAFGTIVYDSDYTYVSPVPFRIIVRLHPAEMAYPMNPNDFITLSRFRREVPQGDDDGYSKNVNDFVIGNNDHDPEYYNIPVNTINSFVGNPPFNLRPRDLHMSPEGNVFLEPDDNLKGDFDPNGRVPVFLYSLPDGRYQFWLFYGFNPSYASPTQTISFSHQGDWENIVVYIENNKIKWAELSQHEDNPRYDASQLEIVEFGGIQTLYIYSANGSHANYTAPGRFNYKFGAYRDFTEKGGYEWIITNNVLDLNVQPWRDYAGAWGEVGQSADTTGPLGPWYKKIS